MIKSVSLFAFVCVALYFNLNLYKFPIMLYGNDAYPIFPWSTEPNMSNSVKPWLAVHLFTALITVILSSYMVAKGYGLCSFTLKKIQYVCYIVFAFLIVINIHHFGSASTMIAIVLNGFPLAISIFGRYKIDLISYKDTDNFWFTVHYFGIIIPIFFEVGMYLTR